MREWRVTQAPPERPSIFTTSDLPKQNSKCPVGSHLSKLTLSCRVKGENGQKKIFCDNIHMKADLAVMRVTAIKMCMSAFYKRTWKTGMTTGFSLSHASLVPKSIFPLG